MQGVILPLALIRHSAIRIKQSAMAVHFVIVPVARVFAALFVVKGAIAVAQGVLYGALVGTFGELYTDHRGSGGLCFGYLGLLLD